VRTEDYALETAEMLPTPAMYKNRSSFLPDYLRRAL
jgi:hypothetical protein